MRPQPRSAEVAVVLRRFGAIGTSRRLIPMPANDNGAPLGVRIARVLALASGAAAILWVASRLLSP